LDYDELNKKFKQGLGLCRRGEVAKAALLFRQVVDSGSEEPLHLSYYGLLTATVHGRRRHGLRLCKRAMEFDPSEPDVVSNLARLYELCGEKKKAINTLRRGLRATPRQPRLLGQIERLSPRNKPPLSMVDRDNPLNKHMAIMLARLGGRYGKEEVSSDKRRREVKELRLAKQG
jgi:tetratricopeptide (TPR) repeat protein